MLPFPKPFEEQFVKKALYNLLYSKHYTLFTLDFFVFQVSVKVWHCQLLPWLQRHAGLLPHHGHESQPPV